MHENWLYISASAYLYPIDWKACNQILLAEQPASEQSKESTKWESMSKNKLVNLDMFKGPVGETKRKQCAINYTATL